MFRTVNTELREPGDPLLSVPSCHEVMRQVRNAGEVCEADRHRPYRVAVEDPDTGELTKQWRHCGSPGPAAR